MRLADDRLVETVAIVHEPEGRTHGRITVCVSSQVGCKMGCTFCATGTMGFQGDLSAGEILEQVPLHTRTPALTPTLTPTLSLSQSLGLGVALSLRLLLSRCCTWSGWRPPSASTGA